MASTGKGEPLPIAEPTMALTATTASIQRQPGPDLSDCTLQQALHGVFFSGASIRHSANTHHVT